MCSRCGNQWSNGRYELHLESQKLRQNAKNRRLIARLDAIKAKLQRGELSTGARKRAKWLKKRMASHMVSPAPEATFVPFNYHKSYFRRWTARFAGTRQCCHWIRAESEPNSKTKKNQ